MNKLTSIAAVGVIALALVACKEENTANTSSGAASAATTAELATMNWPPVPETAVELADNYFQENLVVILDMSGSMGDATCKDSSVTKYAASLQAIDTFIDYVPDDMALGFVVFEDGRNEVRTPLGLQNREQVRRVLGEVRPDGGTPLGGAVYEAYNMLMAQAQSQQGYGNYRMLIVTDGAASDEGTLKRNIDYLTTSTPIDVFTAGFCIDEGHTLYQPGLTEFRAAGNIVELRDAMQAVLAESTDFDQALTFEN